MPAEDSINLDHLLTEQVYPTLYDNLDTAFPEFEWTRKNGHWTANIWPAGFPYTVNDQHADRLMVYEDHPWWIKVHGHSGVRLLDYVNNGRKPEGAEFPAAVRRLCELAGVPFPERPYSEEVWRKLRQRETRRATLDGLVAYAQQALWSPRGERARVYLQERGFTDADVRELGFGFYASVAEAESFLREQECDLQAAKEVGLLWQRLQGYIIIPWFDAQGYPLTLYGRWAAKTPPAGKPKTIALPGEGTKASPLYFDRARKAGHKELVLVEGVFDAALLQVCGDTRVVASVAAQLSGLQLETLVRYRVRSVFICGDPDGGGDQGTIANVDALTKVEIASYIPPRLPDGLDPDEFVLRFEIEGWRAHIAQAISGPRFRIQQLLGPVCPSSPDHERHEAVARVLDYLATLHGEWALLEKEGLIRLTAEHTGYTIALLEEMDKNRTTRQRQQSTNDSATPGQEKAGGAAGDAAWSRTKDAPSFLAEEEVEFKGLAKDLVAPGAITLMAAPRGLGKTQVSHSVAVALATGGQFRGEQVHPVRVLLLDRDNPETVVKQRLRAWGAAQAPNLHILTRQNAPDLKDKAAWAVFPVNEYDVLIVDSVGSSTEGITEKEGKQTTEVLATIVDLARRGVAILLLQNTTKDAVNLKGRGEWADRADIIYEVRDATGLTPSGKKPWWQELPEAGEAAWAERSARRKGRIDFRLAFVPSKFRLAAEPEPFCLELNLPKGAPWTLYDVTADVLQAGEAAKTQQAETKKAHLEKAAEALAQVVKDRPVTDAPLLKTEAETFLCQDPHLTHKAAREVITTNDGQRWKLQKLEGQKGNPQALVPLSQDGVRQKSDRAESPQESRTSEGGISDTGMKSDVKNDLPSRDAPDKAYNGSLFSTSGKSGPSEIGAPISPSNGACRSTSISDAGGVEKDHAGQPCPPESRITNDRRTPETDPLAEEERAAIREEANPGEADAAFSESPERQNTGHAKGYKVESDPSSEFVNDGRAPYEDEL